MNATLSTVNVREIALKCARGSEQNWFVGAALDRPTRSFAQGLKGRAARYSSHYQTSFSNLLDRLRRAGVQVVRTPGPRGGEYSATYQIVAN